MGVEKVIIVEGDEDYDCPTTGSIVNVHYTLMLENGQVVESSLNSKRPFQFTVGEGSYQPTQKQYILIFSIIVDYGYGNKRVGSIPANSILKFEIELIDFI
ncbi:hypothetical protein PPL_01381 [Heterostelium album PN500]|uniref:peptidylprolyl isomerase n=1 Tax=Heterostelium pallidum (strain ATCC 26659 / Pp 5 / PN500) TaxID=670386 RepID=D3AZ41_HETP5|nr:hypothetical protein PPL_01381 [Heterostelium album PN500]EFA85598.1 hypothetical protein PPL_01381 [Heterostelium album PN500]|eukprot:XP_020437705.1 hypothetical protein PPL_01381 [Heterostelium album PN500]